MKRFTSAERRLLSALWPTVVSDKRLAVLFGRQLSSIRKCARDTLRMPPRTAARDLMAEKLIEQCQREARI